MRNLAEGKIWAGIGNKIDCHEEEEKKKAELETHQFISEITMKTNGHPDITFEKVMAVRTKYRQKWTKPTYV